MFEPKKEEKKWVGVQTWHAVINTQHEPPCCHRDTRITLVEVGSFGHVQRQIRTKKTSPQKKNYNKDT